MLIEISLPYLYQHKEKAGEFHQFIQLLQENFRAYYTLGFPHHSKHDHYLLNKGWDVAHGTQEGRWRALTYDEAVKLWLLANMPLLQRL